MYLSGHYGGGCGNTLFRSTTSFSWGNHSCNTFGGEMRDKKRIKRILRKIEKLWNQYPDQRLGQLLENHVFGHHLERGCCLFHFQDEDVEGVLEEINPTERK